MNALLSLETNVGNIAAWHLAGWTMLHYLWLGALVGLAAGVGRLLLRRASANVRYVAALSFLAVLAALPMGIAVWMGAQLQTMPIMANSVFAPSIEIAPSAPGPVGGRTGAAPLRSLADNPPSNRVQSPTVTIPSTNPRQSRGLMDVAAIVAAYLPWLWLSGAPLTFLLLATGVIGSERLRRSSRILHDGPIADTCTRLVEALHIGRRVTVAVCERIAAPVLVGILRPIILLPPAALTGWSPDEIEMVLLHELAHVRRWDNLVNLAQRIVESILFFHPAVWLVSNWVRREREACCDAVVVTRTNRPHAYAELLIDFAQHLSEPSEPGRPRPRFSAAATSAMAAGPLRGRIRRILKLEDDPMLISGKSLVIVMSGLLLAATLVVLNLPTRGQAEESTTESTEHKIDSAKMRAATQNNLKDLAIALLNYESANKSLPPRAKFDASGKPLLSWRVLVLPYLSKAYLNPGSDEAKLYNEFRLDEPWDSDHNRKLIARMPTVFKNPQIDKPGMTNYLAVVGEECLFDEAGEPVQLMSVTDGTSRTIALVEADADRAVEWTKPEDWEFDRAHPTAGLGSLWKDHWYGAWVDGSVRRVRKNEPGDAVGSYFTRAGGESHSLKESDDEQRSGTAGRNASIDAPRKFPSLEDQKLADVVYRQLGLELEPLTADELQRVRALGFEGGIKVTDNNGIMVKTEGKNAILPGDILAGLHVWPTTNLAAVAEVLNRKDLAELNPLKFYVIRRQQVARGGAYGGYRRGYGGEMAGEEETRDEVVTGRFTVNLPERPSQSAPTEPRPPVAAGSDRTPKPQAESQIGTAADSDKPPLRYDGKTFSQWRTEWQTELSTEKRIEAVKALAAFGRAGYGKEAAAVILDVAGEYDFTFLQQDNDPDGKFKQAVIEVLAPESGRPSLAEFWLPDLVARMKDDPGKWKPLLVYAVSQLRTDNPQVIGLLRTLAAEGPAELRGGALGALVRSERTSDRTGKLSEESRKLLGAALVSNDPDRIRSALWLLVYDANNPWAVGWNQMTNPRLLFLPEIVEPLLGADDDVRQRARLQLQYVQAKDAPAMLEQLLRVLHDDSRAAEHVDAIRAIAAMGPAAVAATEELNKIVAGSEDEDAVIAAVFAVACINDKAMMTKLDQGMLDWQAISQSYVSAIHLNRNEADELGKRLNKIERFSPRLEEEAKVIFPESRPRSGGGMF